MTGTLALWLLPDSRMRLLWRPKPIAISDPSTVDSAGAGVVSFVEDLVRVAGVSSLAGLPEHQGMQIPPSCSVIIYEVGIQRVWQHRGSRCAQDAGVKPLACERRTRSVDEVQVRQQMTIGTDG
jgi:hypothetical protein